MNLFNISGKKSVKSHTSEKKCGKRRNCEKMNSLLKDNETMSLYCYENKRIFQSFWKQSLLDEAIPLWILSKINIRNNLVPTANGSIIELNVDSVATHFVRSENNLGCTVSTLVCRMPYFYFLWTWTNTFIKIPDRLN